MEPLQTFVAYTGDAWAIERTLRFFQATFGILATLTTDATSAAHSNLARANIHLARRFYRAFKWVDCAYEVFKDPRYDYGGLHESVRMLKDSSLLMYYFFDMLILPTAIGFARKDWLDSWIEEMAGVRGPGNETIENTALTCWFYAILLSITLGILEISHTPARPTPAPKSEKSPSSKGKSSKKADPANNEPRLKPTSTTVKELICNILDLTIPGTAIGYVKMDPIYVHIAMATSSFITMNTIYNRIYAEKVAAPA